MRIAIFLILVALFATGSDGAADSLMVEPICKVDLGGEEVFLTDPAQLDFPDELLGVMFFNDAIYLYDHISRKLIAFDCDGGELFRFGSIGTGPEDHSTYSDPILWNNEIPSVVDYGIPAKIIQFTEDGEYYNSFPLDTSSEIARLIWAGDRALGVEIGITRDEHGDFVLRVSMVTFDSEGILIQRELLGDHSLAREPNQPPQKVALEVTPRFTFCDGRIFLQRDVYSMQIECLDLDFKRVWSYSEDIKFIPNPEYEAQRALSPLEPAKVLHPIRSMWGREGGALWVEIEDGYVRPGVVSFRCIDSHGQRCGDVALEGFPARREAMIFADNHILWSDINSKYEAGERSVQVFGVPGD